MKAENEPLYIRVLGFFVGKLAILITGDLPMLRKIFIFNLVLMLTACSFVDKVRIREAKLMPRDIAIKTVERFTPMGFSANPALPLANANSPLCKDKDPKPARFEDMFILLGQLDSPNDNKVTISSPYEKIKFCGNTLSIAFTVPSQSDREDLFDALIAMGAKPALVKK